MGFQVVEFLLLCSPQRDASVSEENNELGGWGGGGTQVLGTGVPATANTVNLSKE